MPPLFIEVPKPLIVGKKLILKKLLIIPKYKFGFKVKENILSGFSLIKILINESINLIL